MKPLSALTAALVLLLVVSSCGDDGEPGAGLDLCEQMEGSGFVSEAASSSVMTEDGVVATTEDLEYYDGGVDWYSGDTVESYEWTCTANRVDWVDGYFTATLSIEDGNLTLTEPDGARWISRSAP